MEDPVLSYPERCVKDISIRDVRVSVFGSVRKRDEESFFLDDGTGQVVVFGDVAGDFVRVFGDVILNHAGVELRSSFIQDFSSVSKDLIRQVGRLSSYKPTTL